MSPLGCFWGKVLEGRAAAVVGAMRHAWTGYREHAWGQDNLLPISGRGSSAGFGHAVTLVDSLDTLWLMGKGSVASHHTPHRASLHLTGFPPHPPPRLASQYWH